MKWIPQPRTLPHFFSSEKRIKYFFPHVIFMPAPVSFNEIFTILPARQVLINILPSPGMACMALESMFINTWLICPGNNLFPVYRHSLLLLPRGSYKRCAAG